MYKRIMVPVDLAHKDKLEKAVTTAAHLSELYGAPIYLVGITASPPSAVAVDSEDYAEKLRQYATDQTTRHGVAMEALPLTVPDPAASLDEALDTVAHELGADLIVMASHVPGLKEYIFPSHGGYLASHSDRSVFVVR